MVVAWFKLLQWHFSGATEENRENLSQNSQCPRQGLNWKIPNINQKLHWLKELSREAYIFIGISYKPQEKVLQRNNAAWRLVTRFDTWATFEMKMCCSTLTPCQVYITLGRKCKRERWGSYGGEYEMWRRIDR